MTTNPAVLPIFRKKLKPRTTSNINRENGKKRIISTKKDRFE